MCQKGMFYNGYFLAILSLILSFLSIAAGNSKTLEDEKAEQAVIEAMRADKAIIDEMIAEKAPLEEVLTAKVEFIYKHSPFDAGIPDIISNYEVHSIVPLAINLTKDTNKRVRFYGYRLLISAKQKTNDLNLLNIIIHAFIEGLKDDNNSGTCLKVLMDCQKKDYNVDAKKKLKQRLDEILANRSHGYYARGIILLVSAADMQTEMGRLETIIEQINEPLQPFGAITPKWHKEAFAALKAKARMGDQNAVQQCISLVDAETDEDRKVTTQLKHISYIRQPKAVDYIKQYLYSDKKVASGGPDTVVYPYSYYAAEYLEEMVVGFPTWHEVWGIYKEGSGGDLDFKKKWPLVDNYYGYYCRHWLEAQDSLEIIR